MSKRRRVLSCWTSLVLLLAACSSEGPTPPLEPQPLQFAAIAVANGASCALTDDGSVYCWGVSDGLFGATSFPDCQTQVSTCTTRPRRIDSPLPLTSLTMNSSVFNSYACGLDGAGTPYCWGHMLVDADGIYHLGDVPTALSGGVSLASVSMGMSHICGVAASHDAYCWGTFEGGRRGDPMIGFDTSYATFDPNIVGGALQFTQVVAGAWSTCGLTTGGEAFCWGSNAFGDLGDPTAPVQQECGLAFAPCSKTPVPVAGGRLFTSLSGSGNHVCGHTAAGELYCWGSNGFGQIGTAEDVTEGCCVRQPALVFADAVSFASVSAAGTSTCAVGQDDVGYCWGDNSSGQLGNGGGLATIPVRVLGGHQFESIAIATDHACGLTLEGEALCWGQNSSGQLGTGDQQDSNEPVAVVGPAGD